MNGSTFVFIEKKNPTMDNFFPAQNRPNPNFAITPQKTKTAIKSVLLDRFSKTKKF